MSWLIIAISACVIIVIAEGVHHLMLEHVRVPYPHNEVVPDWAMWLNVTISTFAYILFYRLAAPALQGFGFVAR